MTLYAWQGYPEFVFRVDKQIPMISMKCFSKIFFSIYTADFFNINIFVYVLYLFYSVQADALWPLWVFESQWLCELRDLWGSNRGQIFICWMGYFGHWIGRITVDSTKISKQCESSLNTCTNTYPQTPLPLPPKPPQARAVDLMGK